MWEKFKAWAAAHPYLLGLAVFGVGIILLWLFGFFSRKAPAQDNTAAAYYGAEVAAQQAAVAQNTAIMDNQTNVAAINAQQTVGLAQVGAARDVAMQQSADALLVAQHQFDYLSKASSDAVTIDQQNNLATTHVIDVQGRVQEHASDNSVNVANTQALYGYYGVRDQSIATEQAAAQASMYGYYTARDQAASAEQAAAQASMYGYYATRDQAAAAAQASMYGYYSSADTNTTQRALAQDYYTAMLTGQALDLTAKSGAQVGVWSPTTGQITTVQSGAGGPVDQNTINQYLAYPAFFNKVAA